LTPTGVWKWRVKSNYLIVGAVTPTAGGVVFFGDLGGNFYALDAANGQKLWGEELGGAIGGGVITARRIFPRCWFNEKTTQAGIEALGFYHERRDEARNIGLGPEHDWSSHGCDAFGLMAVVYEEPPVKSARIRRPSPPPIGSHWSA
jgi:hypothetical protein